MAERRWILVKEVARKWKMVVEVLCIKKNNSIHISMLQCPDRTARALQG